MSQSSDLSSLEVLLALIRSGEGIPLNIRITPSDELQALRDQVKQLTEDCDYYKKKLHQCEGYLGDECEVNERLRRLLRENGIKVPPGILR